MTDKQALKLALTAMRHRMKYYKPNANLYRIYGDRNFMSWSDKLTEFEQAEKIIHGMIENYSHNVCSGGEKWTK